MAETFRITGMDCADCARGIEQGVGRLDGVNACAINFGAAMLKVDGTAPREAVIARVRALGYDVREDGARPPAAPATRLEALAARLPASGPFGFLRYLLARRTTALAVLGALLILPSLILVEIGPLFTGARPESSLLDALAVAALLAAGLPIARSAWRSLAINRRVNINVLMTIAAVGAVAIGAFVEAGMVMVLFSIGEALEGYTMDKARNAIKSLIALAPAEAVALRACIDCQEHLGRDGYAGGPCPFCGVEETRVFVDELQLGEIVVVKPGERIPVDGRVTLGASAVNQAPITGESAPVDKAAGSEVFAGTINGEGALEVQVTRLSSDSTLARIIHLVEEAQERKAPAEKFVDRFARAYTPAVVALAAGVASVPPLAFGAPFLGEQGWLYRALELLVVACPCALVISTPVALVSAISNAARNGVLIKGGAHLEQLSRITAVAFDKTGTLTAGKPRVSAVKSAACTSPEAGTCAACDDVLALASAVERRSEHPLAQAVVAAASERRLDGRYAPAEDVRALAGVGVRGRVSGREVLIGSHAYFDSAVPHDAERCAEIDAAAAAGRTAMLVSADNGYLGYITVSDAVRPSSRAAVDELHRLGVRTTVMLTGDTAAAARRIADDVGVSELRAGLLPEHKAEAIRQLQAAHGAVAMVGDGVNDAPALATAALGVAMGEGTAQAIETADIALMGDDMRKLPFALRLSRATMRTIRVNIGLSIGIKAAFLAVVLLGLGTMWMAVLADVGVALLVTLIGMRLLSWRP